MIDSAATSFRATIAVLDDDQRFIRMVERVLASDGLAAAPVTTLDLDEACRVVASLAPALALVDVFMYGNAAGFDLVERLRADPATASLPLLVTSGAHREIAGRLTFLKDHGCGVLLKPFDAEDLLATIHEYESAPLGGEVHTIPAALPEMKVGWLQRFSA